VQLLGKEILKGRLPEARWAQGAEDVLLSPTSCPSLPGMHSWGLETLSFWVFLTQKLTSYLEYVHTHILQGGFSASSQDRGCLTFLLCLTREGKIQLSQQRADS
jgi:hypothetical protein